MSDYQRSAKVKASPDALFDYLSEIGNLPKYFNTMTSAEKSGPNEVHVTANVHGKEEAGKAEFHVDKASKKIRWSSEGPNDYHGELQVSGQGDTSEVSVKLHTTRAGGGDIEQGLQKTLDNIVRLVEQGSAKAA